MAKLEEYDKNMKASETVNGTIYHHPFQEEAFSIEGLPWKDTNQNFYRLPKECEKDVTEAVYWLQKQPSGGQIRFKTNSKFISIHGINEGDYQMCHMAATGQQSIDLYYKTSSMKEYRFFTVAKFQAPASEFKDTLFEADTDEEKDIILNLPLYEGLKDVAIGLDVNATLQKPTPHKNKGKIVIYGTSITQGGCASRPGMSFTNQLSRKLDIEFVNLGFSGSGMGEIEMAKILSSITDVRLFILDYEANGGCTSSLEDHMNDFINILRTSYPTTPILVLSKPPYSSDICKKASWEHRIHLLKFQKELVENRRNNKDLNIYFYDGNQLFGQEDIYEMTVDGLHPTDLGFYFMSKNLYPILKELIK